MYRKILVPIDGSDTATAGLQEAIKLAKDQGARIRLIHVIDEVVAISPHVYGFKPPHLLERMRAAGESVVASARELVQAAGVTVEARIVETVGGGAGDCIVEAAREWPADLIVCGTHGRRGLRRIVMGSDAECIVRRSPVPILLVRARASETQI